MFSNIRGIKKIRVLQKIRSKKGHNSCKNEFKVISLVSTYMPFHSEHIFSVSSIKFINDSDMTKCHNFCMTMTMKLPLPRLLHYLGFSRKTTKLKVLILTSIFSFSHFVFQRLLSEVFLKSELCCKGLNNSYWLVLNFWIGFSFLLFLKSHTLYICYHLTHYRQQNFRLVQIEIVCR